MHKRQTLRNRMYVVKPCTCTGGQSYNYDYRVVQKNWIIDHLSNSAKCWLIFTGLNQQIRPLICNKLIVKDPITS